MYNKTIQVSNEEIPQNEALQPYIKIGKALQRYFIGYAIDLYYTLDLEKISA